jgi:EAL domain-containing protein (putative c-di-GMP-specific phosphodiesterase class I)
MPLKHLIEAFNDRFVTEHNLEAGPLSFDGMNTLGHFRDLLFTSQFMPVRLFRGPSQVIGHDASSLIIDTAQDWESAWLRFGSEMTDIVCLDRLSRTVHILNYLLTPHDEGNLFLHVHPQHVFRVRRDHGAYFEEILQRCGLPLRRMVITLTLNQAYGSDFLLLLDRFKNYRDRGYATAIKFDGLSHAYLEDFCRLSLYRFAPDFVRFRLKQFGACFNDKEGQRALFTLNSVIRRLDTQILVSGVNSEQDARNATFLNPDYVQGKWYETSVVSGQERHRPAARTASESLPAGKAASPMPIPI